MRWKAWQQWPDSRPWASLEDLTDDEQLWVYVQQRIDDGLQLCDECDELGYGTYCGQCGKRYVGGDREWHTCPNEVCRAEVATTFCSRCGAQVVVPDVDWTEFTAIAQAALNRMVEASPRARELLLGEESPVVGGGIVAAVNEVWGRGRSGSKS